jgi:hypothetical protein
MLLAVAGILGVQQDGVAGLVAQADAKERRGRCQALLAVKTQREHCSLSGIDGYCQMRKRTDKHENLLKQG